MHRRLAFAALLGASTAVHAAMPPPTAPATPRTDEAAPRPTLTIGSGRNSTHAPPFTVHYNALPTTMVAPDIARRHGITRSANRALLNVAVTQGPRAAESVAVTARVEAVAINPAGQRQTLRLREVRDRDAIYYLAEARIDERDTIDFELVVTPEGGPSISARYRQEFWPPAPVR